MGIGPPDKRLIITEIYKGVFGCKTSDQIGTESPAEKDAFLPNLVRVYGFIKARAYTI